MYNKKYEITLTVLTIMTVLMTTVGVSFSYFMPGISGEKGNVSVTTDKISSVTFDGGADFATINDIEPGWKGTKTFSITVAPSERPTTVYVKMNYKNGFTDMKAKVTSATTDSGAVGDVVLTTNSKDATQATLSNFNPETVVLVNKTFLASTESVTITYTFEMEFEDTNAVQNYDQGQLFDAVLYAELGDANLYYTNSSPNGTPNKPNAQ